MTLRYRSGRQITTKNISRITRVLCPSMTYLKMVTTYSRRPFRARKDVSSLVGVPFFSSIVRPCYQVHATINNVTWPTDRSSFYASTDEDKGERTKKTRSPETSGWRHRTRTLPGTRPDSHGSPVPAKNENSSLTYVE